VPITQAQRVALDLRLQAHRDNPGEGASWGQVKAGCQY
jgi:hypothetical protein